MADFIHEIRHRRVLPAVGVYAGSCWVLIEILDRLVERYLLSPYITDIAFWGLYSLIPAVTLIAWTHGKPGKDEITRLERVGIPINVIASLGLLITVFGGKDLGAAANLVTVSNEEGVVESHYVPSESYRRRLAVFFFDNDSGDSALDWLQYGVTELVVQDLQQSPFVLATSPWSNFVNGFYSRMRKAGFTDGLGVPRSLMREIADDANRQYFVEGDLDRRDGEYRITARIWETQSLRQIGQTAVSGWDLYDAVDQLSEEIREVLSVPEVSGRVAEDLPLVETYGESESAFRNYVEALNARLFDNDVAASNSLLDAALQDDPGFVLAWYLKAVNLLEAGDLPSSQVAIRKAQELDYRLPARDRAQLKQMQYRLSGETDKLIAFLRMQVKLRDDAAAHSTLANALMITGQLEEAKLQFQAALEKDPLNVGIYLQLSLLERATGNMGSAIDYARRYQQEKPRDIEAHMVLGDYLRDTADLESAETHYTQASMLENQPIIPMLRLADIAARKGDAKQARRIIEQAEDMASLPLEQAQVRQAASMLETRLGRITAAIAQLEALGEYLTESLPPFQYALATYVPMTKCYVDLGDAEQARRALGQAFEIVQPPLDQFLAFSEALILIETGDLDGADAALERGQTIIEQFRLEDLRFQVDFLRGYIERKRGNHVASATEFSAAREKILRTVLAANELGMVLPLMDAEIARSRVASGELDAAEQALNRGMRLDPSEPLLWVAKAEWQQASGLSQLALASVNYALAIWKDADDEYREFARAKALAARLQQEI